MERNLIMGEGYVRIGLLIYLGIMSYMDLKEKSIKATYIFTGILVALVYRLGIIFMGYGTYVTGFYGILPGVIFLLIAKFTEQSIGYGDGLVIIMLGLLLTNMELMYVMIYSFLACFLFSCIFILCKKINTKSAIPFLPFMLLAHVVYFGGIIIGV